jgi:hypothetical protein
MKVVTALALTLLFAWSAAPAEEPASAPHASVKKPTDESIQRLLEIMQAKKVVDALPQQLDAYYSSIMNKALEGKQLSEQQRQTMEKARAKLADLIRENFNWQLMQGIYVEVYSETFSQDEVNGMIKFYSSPVGHAVAVKLPLAMQNSMAVVQQRMQALIPRIQEMMKDAAAAAH